QHQGFTQGQGGNGTLHLFEWSPSWGGWHYGGELTSATGAPLAHQFTDLTSYYFAAENSDHFDYMAVGGHVYEILFASNGWGFHDLSKDARARVTALNGPSGYEFHNLQQVFYRGTDSHVQELSWDVTGWHPRDLTSITGTPTVRGSGPACYGFKAQLTQHVV